MLENVKEYPLASPPPGALSAKQESPLLGQTLYFPDRAEVASFDSSLHDNLFQVVLDGRRYCIDQNVLATLEYFRRGVPADDALRENGARKGIPGTPQLISKLFDRGLLRTAQEFDQETLRGRGPRAKRPPGLFFLIPILPEGAISKVASFFRILFHPQVTLLTGLGIVLAHVGFFLHKHAARGRVRLDTQELLCLIGLVLLSLLFHEIGHAAASEHYGVHPRSLGFGIFWIYPVLFTDVSGTWQLKRWQRAIVAAAGLYFHLIASSIACLVTIATSSKIATLLVYSIWLAVFLNGNPFLQFDGYWILTDLLGIPNLRYQTHSLLKRVLARITGKTPPDQALWHSSRKTRIPVLIYAVAYCGFIVYVANAITRHVLPRLFVSVPLAWQAISQLITSDRFNLASVLILWRVAVIIITIAGIFRIVHRVLAYVYRNLRSVLVKSGRIPA
jgi:putative peptide zinc metalloprotease protein